MLLVVQEPLAHRDLTVRLVSLELVVRKDLKDQKVTVALLVDRGQMDNQEWQEILAIQVRMVRLVLLVLLEIPDLPAHLD